MTETKWSRSHWPDSWKSSERPPNPFLRSFGAHPQIPWKALVGTRDRVIHQYFDVDLDILWKIVPGDLPLLVSELERMVPPQ